MDKSPAISPKACPEYLIFERIPSLKGILFPFAPSPISEPNGIQKKIDF